MNKKQRLMLMGQIVTVNAKMKRVKEGKIRKHVAVPMEHPRAGWVVGFRTVYDGERKPAYNYEDQPYLHVTNSHSVMLVSFWFNTRPVKVPLDGFLIGGTPQYMSDKEKAFLAEYSKQWPRDSKGRWTA